MLRNAGMIRLMCVLILVWGLSGAVLAASGEEGGVELKLSECPSAVQKTLVAEAKGAKIKTVQADTEDGEPEYTAKVVIKQRHYSITVAQSGKLIEKVLDNEKEEEIAFAQCPKAVQRAFEDEAEGVKIEKVQKEICNGEISYTADVAIGADHYWISVAGNGVLIEKSLDEEGDEETATVHQVASQNRTEDHAAANRKGPQSVPGKA